MSSSVIKAQIKEEAHRLGFDLIGVCRPDYSPADHDYLLRWLDKGYHGEMEYMSRNPRQRSDPHLFFEHVRSIISLGTNYYKEPGYDKTKPYISIYARGERYQTVLRKKLKLLLEFIKSVAPDAAGKIAIDTSPTFDKHWAVRSGIGWRGKNTLVLNKKMGSFMFLGEIFLNIEIEPDEPKADHCAGCSKCLEACPTGALQEAYVLDAAKCISYLTIETKNDIEKPELIDNHIAGCDLCQLACPYNKSVPDTKISEFSPEYEKYINLDDLQKKYEKNDFESRYKGTILSEIGFSKYIEIKEMVGNNIKKG